MVFFSFLLQNKKSGEIVSINKLKETYAFTKECFPNSYFLNIKLVRTT